MTRHASGREVTYARALAYALFVEIEHHVVTRTRMPHLRLEELVDGLSALCAEQQQAWTNLPTTSLEAVQAARVEMLAARRALESRACHYRVPPDPTRTELRRRPRSTAAGSADGDT